MTLLDLCAYLGLGATGAASLNLLIGLLISLRYSPVRYWPHLRVNVFGLHRWTAYATVTLTLTHPLVLLFLDRPRFRVFDLMAPIQSPLQPLVNVAGAAALYLLLIVLLTSLLRSRIGRPLWRRLHYLVFPAAILLFVHSILTDPVLKDGRPDLLDGGKVFVEIAALLCFAATALRIRLRGEGLRPVVTSSEAAPVLSSPET
ncbi:MAG: ferric reductase-like transmembrane domain-containing protein [Terracidiphilus sp.]